MHSAATQDHQSSRNQRPCTFRSPMPRLSKQADADRIPDTGRRWTGEFHYIGKEAFTRRVGGVDLSMMSEAGALDPAYEGFLRVRVDAKYLE